MMIIIWRSSASDSAGKFTYRWFTETNINENKQLNESTLLPKLPYSL
jgi:hypothetical protein